MNGAAETVWSFLGMIFFFTCSLIGAFSILGLALMKIKEYSTLILNAINSKT